MDNLKPEQRKKNMQHIKAKDTKIEILLRKALWEKGYRYRKNYNKLPGKPDIALTKYKVAIFCDSEFFHGKDWEVLKLHKNYRSTRQICNFANSMSKYAEPAYRIEMEGQRDGDDVQVIYGSNSDYSNPVDSTHLTKLVKMIRNTDEDCAVLCRTNNEVDNILALLTKNSIPCVNFRKSELTLEELNEKVNSDVVKVLTIHSAKGLESKNVMVIGAKTWNAEELRVCYVAATRAKERLIWLTEPKKTYKRKQQYNMTSWG